MRNLILFILSVLIQTHAQAQCCAAGGGCPIAGGACVGVLQEQQVELNVNYQVVSTTKFLNEDSPDKNFLDRYSSQYGYYRLGYGITKYLTLSLESGYYFDKTQIGLDRRDTISTKGWSDLIVFPRYDVLNRSSGNKHSEITIGLGMKIPIGNARDTLKQIESFSGSVYYILKPVAIRTTTGAQDFIFYLSLLRGYPAKNFLVFSNMLYVKKGWNELGEKAGDYASIGLYASKTFFDQLSVTLQVKGEWIDKMRVNDNLKLFGFFNYDPDATGSKKVLLVPQVSYSYKSFTVFGSGEFPLYQYVNKQQIASQYYFTAGISYKFNPFGKKIVSGTYYCPMHPEQTSAVPGKCPLCGMDLEVKK